MLPEKLLVGTQSNAERKVFYALKDLLSSEYTVFHHLPVYRPANASGGLLDGEIDFLIVHPEFGAIVVEVKGGGIIHESESGEWSTIDARGATHTIRDPFEQAKSYKYFLIGDLGDCRITKGYSYPIGHAVWLPDVDLSAHSLGFSTSIHRITLDSHDLPAAVTSVPRVFEASLGTTRFRPPGHAGVEALVRYLAPSWEIRPSLSAEMVDEDRHILEATKSQYRILSLLGRVPRALICGCAGSGKTLLAMEKARCLSSAGLQVLILCFNKRLAAWMESQIPGGIGIDVFHFHGFCAHMCRAVNLPIPTPDPIDHEETYYKYDLPEALMDALARTDHRYDAVIADEGQDFLSSWWIPILESLADPNGGTCYIFFDDNQTIYRREAGFPFTGPLFQLLENCRNTKKIHSEVAKFYRGDGHPQAIGPEGRRPEFVIASDGKQGLREVVRHLLQDGVKAKDISILTPLNPQRSVLKEGESIGNLRLAWDSSIEQNTIRCSTIHSFKGLESPVVILFELMELHPQTRTEMLYVGMSRAKNHLVFILPDEHSRALLGGRPSLHPENPGKGGSR